MNHTEWSRARHVTIAHLIVAFGLWVSATPAQAAPFIEGLGTLPGQTESRAFGATADGCIVVGNSGEAFIHETNFMRKLRDSGFAAETAVAVSEGGVLSAGNNGSGMWGVQPTTAWWSLRSSVSEVPVPHQFTDASVANDMSSSGLTAVGSAAGTYGHDTFPWEAYRWTYQDGFSFLDSHPSPIASPNSPASSAEAVSSDGSIAVGWARYVGSYGTGFDDFREAVRWDGTVLTQLGFAAGATNSEATGISADGSVIVGFSDGVGFRHSDGVLEEIGSIIPSDVSGDGSVIVGQLAGGTAQIWDATDGQRDLSTWLSNEHGVDLTGWTLNTVEAVSDDGRAFVGNGTNPEGGVEAWRVALDNCVSEIRLLPPGEGSTWSVAAQPDDSAIALSYWANPSVFIVPRIGSPIEVNGPGNSHSELFPGPNGSFYVTSSSPYGILRRIGSDRNVTTLYDISARPDTPNYIIDLAVSPDESIVFTTRREVIRIDVGGIVTVLLDSETAAARIGVQAVDFDRFESVEIAGDNTVYVQVRYGGFLTAVLEIDPSGTLHVHLQLREGADHFRFMDLSPGGELWLWGDTPARLDDEPFEFSHLETTITVPGSTRWLGTGDVTHMEVMPNGKLLLKLQRYPEYFWVGLDPIEYDFVSDPATVFAGPLLGAAGRNFAVSDRAIYVATGGDSIIRIPQDFGTPACSDGIDNDGDGLTDWPDDPGCTVAEDEAEYQSTYACDDGIDNDGDGLTDFGGGDPGCLGPRFDNEAPQCNDGINNDPRQDALVDMDDPKCKSPGDPSESCGLGFELALILPVILAMRQRRRSWPTAVGTGNAS